jgi:hypothetical protein
VKIELVTVRERLVAIAVVLGSSIVAVATPFIMRAIMDDAIATRTVKKFVAPHLHDRACIDFEDYLPSGRACRKRVCRANIPDAPSHSPAFHGLQKVSVGI